MSSDDNDDNDDDIDLRQDPPILPVPEEDIAESLGHRDGDRLEIYWEVSAGANYRTVYHWWGCELLPLSMKHKKRGEHKAARTIRYDPYPEGGFYRHERNKVIFLNGTWLKDVDSGKTLLYRRVHDDEATVIQSLREQSAQRRRESSKKRKQVRNSESSNKQQRSHASPNAGSAKPDDNDGAYEKQKEENAVETYLSMTPENWWNIDMDDTKPRHATRLIQRCMRKFGYDLKYGERVLAAYEQFLVTVTDRQDWLVKETIPCKPVEEIWHEHIMDTMNYRRDCLLLCGHEVHFDPDRPRPTVDKFETTKAALRNVYQQELDEEIWAEAPSGLRKAVVPPVAKKSAEDQSTPPMNCESPESQVKAPSEHSPKKPEASATPTKFSPEKRTPTTTPATTSGVSRDQKSISAKGQLLRDTHHLQPGKIYVQVILDGSSTYYVFKLSKPLKKVLEATADSKKLSVTSMTFVQKNGRVLNGTETAKQLSDYKEGSNIVTIDCCINNKDK